MAFRRLSAALGTYELVFWRSVFMFLGTMSILTVKGINPLGPPGSRVLLWVRAAAGFGFMSGHLALDHARPLRSRLNAFGKGHRLA